MIKYIYVSKNKKSGNFNHPQLHDFPKENAAETFAISAKETPVAGIEAIKELEIYYLGTFDTKTAEIKKELEYLIDLGAVLEGDGATSTSKKS